MFFKVTAKFNVRTFTGTQIVPDKYCFCVKHTLNLYDTKFRYENLKRGTQLKIFLL